MTIASFTRNSNRILAMILVKPLLARLSSVDCTLPSRALSSLIQTRAMSLIILTLEFQPLMRKLRLFRPAHTTTKCSLLSHRRAMYRVRNGTRIRARILARRGPAP